MGRQGLYAARHRAGTVGVHVHVADALRTGALVAGLALLLQHHPAPFRPRVLEPHLKQNEGVSRKSLGANSNSFHDFIKRWFAVSKRHFNTKFVRYRSMNAVVCGRVSLS